MKLITALIIGCGAISHTHVSAIKDGKLGEIAAVCDIVPERAEELAEEIGGEVTVYSDYKDMLENHPHATVVHICTPHYLHAEMAIYCMKKGFDVYLEKPCAMTVSQAKEILRVSEETGKRVCVSFQNRLIKTTVKAKEIVDSGELGKLRGLKGIVTWERTGKYYTESKWRGKWATEGGGVLMNQSIHTLDLLYYFGGNVKSVDGSASLRKNADIIEVEDTAEATILFESGISAIFYATNCNVTSNPAEIELILEKGSLLIRDDILYVNRGDGFAEAVSNDGARVGKAVWGSGHLAMINSFYRAILGDDCYYCDISDGYKVLEIIEKIYASSPYKLR